MKTYFTRLALIAVMGFAGAGFAGADTWDKKTIITTEEAMQLPNMTLQPGTYVIRLAESPAQRHLVQIFDKDEKHLVTSILAIPNERLRVTGKSVFAFWEVPAGQPKALRAWFYPGDNFGQEFAYPKTEAARITANNQGATVPVNDEKINMAASDKSTVASASAEPAPAPEPMPVAAPAPPEPPAQVEVAAAPQQNTQPAVEAHPAPAVHSSETTPQVMAQATPSQSLPQTASNLPLIGLLGLLSIFGAFALKLASNRS